MASNWELAREGKGFQEELGLLPLLQSGEPSDLSEDVPSRLLTDALAMMRLSQLSDPFTSAGGRRATIW